MKKRSLFVVFLLLTTAALAEDPPPSPWTGSGEVSFVSTSGNTDTQTLGVGFALDYKPGVWTSELKMNFIRSENEGELSAEKLTGLVGVRRVLSPRFDIYARTDFLRNEFAGINSSWGIQAGGLYKALTGERHVLDLTAGLGYTAEDRVNESNRNFGMGTMGGNYKWKISESTGLTNDLALVFSVDESSDWRLANTTALTTAINSLFSLKVSYALNHQNEPPAGFDKRDTVTSVALVAKF